MQPEIGKIYEGKVTGITKFGAFVEIEPGTTGMVHISEISTSYVNEVKDFLTEGQVVKVKVLAVTEEGKISLSIKKALPRPEGDGGKRHNGNRSGGDRGDRGDRDDRGDRQNRGGGRQSGNRTDNRGGAGKRSRSQDQAPVTPEAAFEDMISKFKASSDERMSDIKKNMNNKRRDTSRKR